MTIDLPKCVVTSKLVFESYCSLKCFRYHDLCVVLYFCLPSHWREGRSPINRICSATMHSSITLQHRLINHTSLCQSVKSNAWSNDNREAVGNKMQTDFSRFLSSYISFHSWIDWNFLLLLVHTTNQNGLIKIYFFMVWGAMLQKGSLFTVAFTTWFVSFEYNIYLLRCEPNCFKQFGEWWGNRKERKWEANGLACISWA